MPGRVDKHSCFVFVKFQVCGFNFCLQDGLYCAMCCALCFSAFAVGRRCDRALEYTTQFPFKPLLFF